MPPDHAVGVIELFVYPAIISPYPSYPSLLSIFDSAFDFLLSPVSYIRAS